MKKIINFVLLFTLFYSCVAGDVGGDKSKDSAGSSAGAETPTNPQVSASSPTTTLPVNTDTNLLITSLTFDATIANPDNVYYESVWYLDSDGNGVISLAETSAPSINNVPAITIDPSTLGVGTYSVYLEVTDGAGTVFDSRAWSAVVATPDFSTVSFIPVQPPVGTSYHAKVGITRALGGFTYDGTTDNRGVSFVGTGVPNDDFCVTINSVPIGDFGSNYYIVFYDNSNNNLTPIGAEALTGNPLAVNRSATRSFSPALPSTKCLFDNFTSNVVYSGIPRADKIIAKIYSSAFISTPEAYTKEWNIDVEGVNTSPIITNTSGHTVSPAITNVNQNNSLTFSYTVADKDQDSSLDADFTTSYTINSGPLDGTSLFPVTTNVTPDCSHTTASGIVPVSNKYVCTISFPSYGTAGSIDPTTTYTIQASVSDSTGLPSNTLTWLVTPTEISTIPVIMAITNPGAGNATVDMTATATTASYVHYSAGINTSVTTATETLPLATSQLVIRAMVSDAERDDYDVIFSYYDQKSVGYVDLETIAVTKSTDTISEQTVSTAFVVPESALTAAADTGTINFRISVTDKPDTGALALTATQDFDLTVSQYNPVPTLNTITVAPLVGGTYDVMEGKPITFQISGGAAADTSNLAANDGATLEYQWQIDTDCGGAAVYADIAGATATSLKWTPDLDGGLVDAQTVCFRLCIGDNGHNNAANCTDVAALPAAQTALIGGDWTGGVTIRESDKATLAGASSKIFSLMNGNDLITVTQTGTNFSITKNTYTTATGVYSASTTLAAQGSDQASVTNEIPTDISITTDGTSLFVAYLISESDSFVTPTSVARVMVFDITGGTATYSTTFDKNIVSNDIGSISVHGTDWYLPFIDFNNSDNISIVKKPVAHIDNTTNPILLAEITNSALNVTTYNEVSSVYDSANSNLILALKVSASDVYDLRSIDISGATPSDTTNSSSNIFSGNAITSFVLAAPNAANTFVYAGGVFGTKFVSYHEGSDLTGAGTYLSTISSTIVELQTNVNALQIVAGENIGEVLVGTRFSDNNAYLTKIDTTWATAKRSAKDINNTSNNVASSGTNEFSLVIKNNYIVGDDGSVLNEATKDTVIFGYHDGTDSRSSFINIEDETGTSGATPYFQ